MWCFRSSTRPTTPGIGKSVPGARSSPELAELVGYFMGDGSLHAKGIRLCVANTDLAMVAGHLSVLSKESVGLEPSLPQHGRDTRRLTLQSVRLARWWQAAGFAKGLPDAGHSRQGLDPRESRRRSLRQTIRWSTAFLRGLFEADGTVLKGVPSLSTARVIRRRDPHDAPDTGLAATTRETVSGWGGPIFQVRLRNVDHALNFGELIGFIGQRKGCLVAETGAGAVGKEGLRVPAR